MNYENDFYQKLFKNGEEDLFTDEIETHEQNLRRLEESPKDLNFYGIDDVDPTTKEATLCRLVDNELEWITIPIEDSMSAAWADTFSVGTCLAVKHVGIGGVESYYPVSDNIKLSITNRAGLSYKGYIRDNTHLYGVKPVALASTIESLVRAYNKNKLKLVIDGGKCQAILTARYVPSDQRKIFAEAKKFLSDETPCDFAGGYVSHTYSECYYKVASEGREIEATVRVRDSSTGDGSIAVTPRITTYENGKTISVAGDDEWLQRHSKFDSKDYKEGILSCITKVKEWSAKLAESMMYPIKDANKFFDKAIAELNKLARKMSSSPIGKDAKEKLKQEVDTLVQFQTLTLWDFIEILWQLPAKAQSEASRESLEKTVSRILVLDIDSLNA